jgi:hypothetical protein
LEAGSGQPPDGEWGLREGNTASVRAARRSAEPTSGPGVEPYEGEHAPPQRQRRLFQTGRNWLWFILTVTTVFTGMSAGWSMVLNPGYEPATYALIAFLGLTVGLVLGVAVAYLLEHRDNSRRPSKKARKHPNPKPTAKKRLRKRPSGSLAEDTSELTPNTSPDGDARNARDDA